MKLHGPGRGLRLRGVAAPNGVAMTVVHGLLVTTLTLSRAAPAAAQVDCESWGSGFFFSPASAGDVRRCLEAGADVRARFDRGLTSLHLAAYWTGDPAVIAVLVEAGGDVNARDSTGGTPLHHANVRPDVAAALVAAGADLGARDEADNTPLHASLMQGNPDVVMKLLELGADPAARNDLGHSADPAGCENWSTRTFARVADADLVAGCIESGWDVDLRDGHGSTPLHQAVGNEDPALATLLLEAGADPNATDRDGWTPLHRALRSDAHPAVFSALIAAGADANARGWMGMTPLHEDPGPAFLAGLLAAAADVNVRDDNGDTPLHFSRDTATIRLLVGAGADLNARNRRGNTPLHAASHRRNLDPARQLIRLGGDPGARNEEGETPLHVAAWNENPAVVALLLGSWKPAPTWRPRRTGVGHLCMRLSAGGRRWRRRSCWRPARM